MGKRGIPKGYTYQGFEVLCQLCGRKFKTPQALSGHNRFKHSGPLASFGPRKVDSGASVERAGPGPASAAENANLQNEIERMELQQKLVDLKARQTSKVRLPDLSEQAGLGPMRENVAAEVQARAFDVPGPAAKGGVDWLSLLNSPNLPAILQLLRGGLGGSASGSGLEILRELGIDLKDLLAGRDAPKAGSMTVAGLDLTGAALTPELLKSVLEFRAVEEKTKSDFDGRKQMADSLQELVKLLAPHLPGLFPGHGPSPGQAAGIGGRPGGPEVQDLQPQSAACPVCGQGIAIPRGFSGGRLHCEAKMADGSTCYGQLDLEVIPESGPEVARGKKKRKAKPEPPPELKCDCGQLVDVSGKALGDLIRCPVCQVEVTLVSDTESLPAEEPLTEEQKRDQAWRDRFKT